MARLVIGVDVGDNYTDAVILKKKELISEVKRLTTNDRTSGILSVIEGVIEELIRTSCKGDYSSQEDVINYTKRINIGTTHFENALVEQQNLEKVGVLRLCGSASLALPPFTDFPEQLKQKVYGGYALLQGGFEYTKQEISSIDKEEILQKVNDMWNVSGIQNFVVCGIFSPLDHSQEDTAAKIIRNVYADASITVSHLFGQFGLLERETAAILNESLRPYCDGVVTELQKLLHDMGFTKKCALYFTQNDGTLMSKEMVKELPVLTIMSGKANSLRGAAFLSGIQDGVVVDVGGTTTSAGVVKSGYPVTSYGNFKLPGGGIQASFRIPNVNNIKLGGGTIISKSNEHVHVGPDSVGQELEKRGVAFGGDTVTATDIGIVTGLVAPFGSAVIPKTINGQTAYSATMQVYRMIGDVIDTVKTSGRDVPVLVVGGGSILVDTDFWEYTGVSSLQRTAHYDVASAVGAAIARVSAEYSTNLSSKSTEAIDLTFEECVEKATAKAITSGANPKSIAVLEKSTIGDYVKIVHVKVVGVLEEDYEEGEDVPTVQADPNSEGLPLGCHPNPEKDNPAWPFQSEEEEKLDKKFGLPDPIINSAGEWMLTAEDIDCLCIGAGILGSGGGGSPRVGKLLAKKIVNEGKQIRVVNPFRLDPSKQGNTVAVAFMGSPVVIREKLISGNETTLAYDGMKKLLSSGISESDGDDSSSLEKRNITSFFCFETGGINSIVPLISGPDSGVIVLDADGMGRAFPKLQMFTPYIYGVTDYCGCAADNKGRVETIHKVPSAELLEAAIRDICIQMGYVCALTASPLKLGEVFKACVLYSISKAWGIGRAVQRSQIAQQDPVNAILSSIVGKLLIKGKVVEIGRTTEGGFDHGFLVIQGFDKFLGKIVQVLYHNENLVAHYTEGEDTSIVVDQVLATTPDIIAVLDSENGEPIANEELKYGVKVAVIVLEANPLMKTKKALKVVGPKAFGYEFDYIPFMDTK